MSLSELQVHHLRNITQANLIFHPFFNIIYGPNGSGKTSLLEAIYLLSAGYSFKTRETLPLVQYSFSHLTVFARTFNDESISLRKTIGGPTCVKLNAQFCQNSSVLAKFLPSLVFYQDIFQIIDAGPSVRRSLLDWGVFHVKHEYHSLWSDYRQVLKQRNTLLRKKANKNEVIPWDRQLVSLAKGLDQLRKAYFETWEQVFQHYLSQLSNIQCSITYYRGWRTRHGEELEDVLEEQYFSDCQRQYTQSGAHQADIRIETTNATAKQGLSRGQQKMILIALKLAQGYLLEKECIYLFDDLSSELDEEHINRLLNCLKTIKGQKIITVLDPKILSCYFDNDEVKYYNLEDSLGPRC